MCSTCAPSKHSPTPNFKTRIENKNNIIEWRMSNIDYYYSQGFAKWPSKLTSIRKEFSLITTTITTIGSIQLLFLINPGATAPISRMMNRHVTHFSHPSLTKDIYNVVRKIFARLNIVEEKSYSKHRINFCFTFQV